ncbi:hypothetical protein SDC9_106721 [bioreactor metagenome]|uniref:Helix-turn-helix type 11 domain-containing protein n=1 Tax=bioreactor metagenome TaxID=1076179 RepID=A0A645B376_9ZZZZ
MSKPSEMIFEYLSQNKALTIPQLSQALHLTRADIRHHLAELMHEERVLKLSPSSEDQVGRPAHRYQAILPLNRNWIQTLVQTQYQLLCNLGLTESEIACHFAASLLEGFAPGGHATSKLSQAVTYLKTKGIEAKWIAGPDGPLITLAGTDFLTHTLAQAIVERIQKEL